MSQISELTDRFNTRFDEISTGVDEIAASVPAITGDVVFLKETIAKLQSNPGTFTPEDQALVDAAEARLNDLSSRVTAVAAAVKELDQQTENPPVE